MGRYQSYDGFKNFSNPRAFYKDVGFKFDKLFDVVIDFSLPIPSIATINKCVELRKAITIGTTGFDNDQLDIISKASKTIPILLAPNMSQGVNVTLKSLASMSKAI